MKKVFNNKGLTLVEIIVTLAVLGTVISPLMGMFITSQKINSEGNEEYKTLQLAQKYMEDIKSSDTLHEITDVKHYMLKEDRTYFAPNPSEDIPYKVLIDIVPNNAVSTGDFYIEGSPILTVEEDLASWKNNSEATQIDKTITDGIVDITFKSNEVILLGDVYPIITDNLNIYLQTEATLNFIDNSKSANIYVKDNDYKWVSNIYGGEAPNIVIVKNIIANEKLYDITVNVYKSGTPDVLVNSLKSTTVFR